jgi:hypothetical protein
MQSMVDIPTWMSAYEHFRQKHTHSESVGLADKIVTDLMGGNRQTDIPKTMQKEMWRILFPFASYKIAVINTVRASLRRNGINAPNDFITANGAKFALESFMAMMAPAIAYQLASTVLKGAEFGPDDDTGKEWAKFLAKQTIIEMTNLHPISAMGNAALSGFQGGVVSDRPVEAVAKLFNQFLKEGDKEIKIDSLIINTIRSAQLVTPMANEQIIKTFRALSSASTDRDPQWRDWLQAVFGEPPQNAK